MCMLKRHSYELWQDKDALIWAYHEKDLSSRGVADLFGCSKSAVLRWMDKHDIDRDPGPYRDGPWKDADTFRREYVDNEKSMSDLADEWDTSTAIIHNWAKRHGIEARGQLSGERHWNYQGGDAGPGERECPECGDMHTPSDNRVKFCSQECHFESMRNRVQLECETCGDVFTVVKAREDTAKYCSIECRDAYDEIECKQCGTVFEAFPSRNRKFCSKECGYEYRTGENHPNKKEWITTECTWCGNQFDMMPYKYRSADRHFCGEDCRAEWVGEFHTGRNTGEDHWMYNIDPEDHPMWNGGSFPYGPGWNERKKQAVRERDGYECVICGMSKTEHYDTYGENLHVHHIVKARNFDDPERRNAMDNLVTMCNSCHKEYEGLPMDVRV